MYCIVLACFDWLMNFARVKEEWMQGRSRIRKYISECLIHSRRNVRTSGYTLARVRENGVKFLKSDWLRPHLGLNGGRVTFLFRLFFPGFETRKREWRWPYAKNMGYFRGCTSLLPFSLLLIRYFWHEFSIFTHLLTLSSLLFRVVYRICSVLLKGRK